MKLRYIITAFVSALVLAGCQTEPMVGSFSDFSLDKTFVSIPMTGGSMDVTISTSPNADWAFTKHYNTGKKDDDGNKIYDYAPDWVTITPLEGKGGKTITISATATESGRETELQIKCGDHLQHLMVRQGTVEAVAATCKEVMEGPDGKNFKVTAKVTKIANTTYGNLYIDDGSYEGYSGGNADGVYVYGTLDKDGKEKNFLSLGIEVGDVITVSGPKTTYNGTVELVNVTVHKIEKALLTVLTEEPVLEQPGGEFEVKIAYKGSGAYASIDETAAEWLSLKDSEYTAGVPTIFEKSPADTVVFTFTATPNDGEKARKGKVTFFSSKWDESSEETISTTMEYTVSQKSGSKKGTLEEPYSVAEITEVVLGGETPKDVYIKGTISAILYSFSSNYGTATFWISDDGVAHGVSADKKSTTEPTKDFECYSVYWFDNKAWADGNAQIEVGDEVVVFGNTTLYNGIAETASKAAWVYSINGITTDVNGIGNASYPFNIAGAEALIDIQQAAIAAAKEESKPAPVFPDVCVKGYVSAILYTFSANYGTATFWISDDGIAYGVSDDKKSTTVPSKDFECYSVYYLGNQPWTEGSTQIAVGDEVIVKGQLTLYGTTYETSSKKAWVYSLNGVNE